MRSIGVFRALALGDMLCATPALRALRRAWPDARITLIGLPWARALVDRLAALDDFIAFPGFPGMPEREPDIGAFPDFLREAQSREFELIVQLHGSGLLTNPIVAACEATTAAGFFKAGEYCPDPARFIEWPEHGHEIERLLAVVDALGIPRDGTALDFPLTHADAMALERIAPGLDAKPFVCLHPGARLPSRRWPAERFAAVADALASEGLTVVVTGSESERAIAGEVLRRAKAPLVDLVGRTSLWTLGAVVDRAALVVSNDTGISHVAAARRTPSVIVSAGSDPARWAPLDTERHRFLWRATACRPCLNEVCPTAHECATGLGVDEVVAAALAMIGKDVRRAA